jgi:hypothetical protein
VLRSLVIEEKTKVAVREQMGISRPTLDGYLKAAKEHLRDVMAPADPEPMSDDETTMLHAILKDMFGDEPPARMHGKALEAWWIRYQYQLFLRNCACICRKPSGRQFNSPQELERQFFTANEPHKLVQSNAHDGSMPLWTISAKKHKHYAINAPVLEGLARDGMKGYADTPNYDPDSKDTYTIKPIGGFGRPETAGVDYEDLDDEEKKRIKEPKAPRVSRGKRRPVDRTWRVEGDYLVIPAGARTKECAQSYSGSGTLWIKRTIAKEPGDYLYARLRRAADAAARVRVLAEHRGVHPPEEEELPLAA